MRLRLADGSLLPLGGEGDFLLVRYAECRGALLDAFYRAPWYPGDNHLRLAMRDPYVWRYRFPWPNEDGQCVDQIEHREMHYRAPHPLFVPMEVARGLQHDDLLLRASRRDGSYGVKVRVPCANARSRNGIYADPAWEELDEAGRPFSVFECSLCHQEFSLGERQIDVLRRWNEPARDDGSEGARTMRVILERLRPCLDSSLTIG